MNYKEFLLSFESYRGFEKQMKVKHPEVLDMLDNFNKDNNLGISSYSQLIYHYVNDMDYKHECECGKETKFISFNAGYRKFCSNKCSVNSEETILKRKETNIEKYGTDNVFKTDKFKEDRKKNNLKKYGVEHILQNKDILDKKINTTKEKYGVEYYTQDKNNVDKIIKSNLEKYGKTTPNQTEEIKEKNRVNTQQAIKDKYGVTNAFQIPEVKEKIEYNNNEKYLENMIEMLGDEYSIVDRNGSNYTLLHKDCNQEFDINYNLVFSRKKHGSVICTKCNPIGINKEKEDKFYLELNDIDNTVVRNDRKVLEGKEIDFLFNGLGVELNGNYWHSDLFKDNNYHYNKYKKANEKNIQLLSFFEDEVDLKKDIVISIIKSKLGRIENKVYARKCVIKTVDYNEANIFLNDNHIQGECKHSIRYGLYYNGELVSLMTFIKARESLNGGDSLELNRFCNKLNVTVVGGFSKLLKHHRRSDKRVIISFSDNRISDGNVYNVNGFIKVHETKPDYYVIKNNVRYHRFKYRKSELVKLGYKSELSESEILKEMGLNKIYDCGKIKWKLE